jgi:hypothetical protein
MARALEAQETQRRAQAEAGGGSASDAEAKNGAERASSTRVKGKGRGSESPPRKGSESPTRIVPASSMKYASDLKRRNGAVGDGNGREEDDVPSMTPSTLPRKRRGKR